LGFCVTGFGSCGLEWRAPGPRSVRRRRRMGSGTEGLDAYAESSIPRELDYSTEALDHVVVIVHGVGDMMFDNPPWVRSLGRSVRIMTRLLERAARERERDTRTASPTVLLRTIEWHSSIHAEWGKLIQMATPEFPFACHNAVRGTLQDSVGDLMLFMSARWKARLIREVASQIEEEFKRLKEVRPSWNGRMSLYCHSLGAAIVFEVIRNSMLSVPIEMVFCCGSPLSAYLTLVDSGVEDLRRILLSASEPRFYNVYHPLDPSAFRLEPFLLPEASKASTPRAVLLPRRKSWLDEVAGFVVSLFQDVTALTSAKEKRRNFSTSAHAFFPAKSLPASWDSPQAHDLFDDTSSDVTSLSSSPSAQDVSVCGEDDTRARWVKSMGGRRFDFEIDDGVRDSVHWEPFIHVGCLSAHFGYWVSPDVMRFIIDRLADHKMKHDKL